MKTHWILKPRGNGESPDIAGGVNDATVDGSVISMASFAAVDDPASLPMNSNRHSACLGDWFSVQRGEGPWAEIRIEGDCPWLDRLGGAAPGSVLGMDGGRIVVRGGVGSLVGHRMRRGEILVDGNVGSHAGSRMIAGTILVTGSVGEFPMMSASRGTLIYSQPMDWQRDRFSRPMPADFGYAALVSVDPKDVAIANLLERCGKARVELRRGDLVTGGQAEIVCPIG